MLINDTMYIMNQNVTKYPNLKETADHDYTISIAILTDDNCQISGFKIPKMGNLL